MATNDLSSFLRTLQPNQFSLEIRRQVWAKARVVPGKDANVIRMDACGAWIKWAEYGNTKSQWGWEIDHIIPVSTGGGDQIGNLQPLQWQNNRAKGDSSILACPVRAAA